MLPGVDAPWLAEWRPVPLLGVLAAGAAAAYAAAWRRARRDGRRRRLERWRAWSFGAGVAVLAAAWLSPLAGLDRVLLSASFGSMFLVSTLAPALLLLGQPLTLAYRASGPRARRHLRRLTRSAPLRLVTFPVVAWLLYAWITYAWQFSSLTDWAMRNYGVWLAQQLSLLAAGAAFWWPGLCSDPPPWRMGYTLRVFYVFVEMTHKGLFGAMFLAAQEPFHPSVATRLPNWAPAALTDQRLGILLVSVGGSLVFFFAIVGIVREWMAYDARYSRRLDARLARQREAEQRRRAALEQIFRRPI